MRKNLENRVTRLTVKHKCATVSNMVKQADKVIGFRANRADQRIIERLKKRLGVRADSEIIRQALRCLDQKEK